MGIPFEANIGVGRLSESLKLGTETGRSQSRFSTKRRSSEKSESINTLPKTSHCDTWYPCSVVLPHGTSRCLRRHCCQDRHASPVCIYRHGAIKHGFHNQLPDIQCRRFDKDLRLNNFTARIFSPFIIIWLQT